MDENEKDQPIDLTQWKTQRLAKQAGISPETTETLREFIEVGEQIERSLKRLFVFSGILIAIGVVVVAFIIKGWLPGLSF